jgi:hypothetical protein
LGVITVTKGTWLLTGNCYIVIPSDVEVIQTWWKDTTTTPDRDAYALQQFGKQTGSINFGVTNTTCFYADKTIVLNLRVTVNYSSGSASTLAYGYKVQAVRIA